MIYLKITDAKDIRKFIIACIIKFKIFSLFHNFLFITFEQQHEIFNNVVCATSKGSDQPAHMRSPIRAFASRLHIL